MNKTTNVTMNIQAIAKFHSRINLVLNDEILNNHPMMIKSQFRSGGCFTGISDLKDFIHINTTSKQRSGGSFMDLPNKDLEKVMSNKELLIESRKFSPSIEMLKRYPINALGQIVSKKDKLDGLILTRHDLAEQIFGNDYIIITNSKQRSGGSFND